MYSYNSPLPSRCRSRVVSHCRILLPLTGRSPVASPRPSPARFANDQKPFSYCGGARSRAPFGFLVL